MNYLNQAGDFATGLFDQASNLAKDHYNNMPNNILDATKTSALVTAGLSAVMSGFTVSVILTATSCAAATTVVSAAVQPIFNEFAKSTDYPKLMFAAQQITAVAIVGATTAAFSIPAGPILATSLAFNIAFGFANFNIDSHVNPFVFGA